MIQTVTGPIAPEALGFCQPHEHLFVRRTPAAEVNPALQIEDEARSVSEVAAYRDAGGGAIVDCQPGGAGRDLHVLRRISRETGVRIVGVTGYHMPGFYPEGHWRFSESREALQERFLRELTEGVREPGEEVPVFPGAVKAAIGTDGPVGRFAVCLRAAAGAAARAGVPLILHTEYGAGTVEAVRICEAEGLDPARIAVCHVDRQASDYAPHEAVARTGAYLEYDTIARYKYHDDPSEVALIRHMLELGYAGRLLMSLDTTAARLRSYGGAPGLTDILGHFIPMLMDAGVSRMEIDEITRENPKNLFM